MHNLSLITIPSTTFPPFASHFCPAITYCPPKNTAILLSFALTPYAVTPERRTDSKPFRRRFVRKTGFGSCRRKFLQKYFRQSFESSPESRGSQTSGVLPILFVQAKRIKPFPLPGTSRFSKPRFSSPQWRLRTNIIKSFAASRPLCRPAATFFYFL